MKSPSGNRKTRRWKDDAAKEKARPPSVLLAEDDPDMRELLTEALENDGYEVFEAETGTRLVELIGKMCVGSWNRPPIDVIVSDVRMPGLSGLQVLAGFRRIDWSTPFVLITAFGNDFVHAEAKRMGAAAVLNKPFDILELTTTLRSLLPSSNGPIPGAGVIQSGGPRSKPEPCP